MGCTKVSVVSRLFRFSRLYPCKPTFHEAALAIHDVIDARLGLWVTASFSDLFNREHLGEAEDVKIEALKRLRGCLACKPSRTALSLRPCGTYLPLFTPWPFGKLRHSNSDRGGSGPREDGEQREDEERSFAHSGPLSLTLPIIQR